VTPQRRYLNDLRLLDQQIERIYTGLKDAGLLDRTILLLVGDHGEAFGQHPGNFTHSRHSFNENFQTPALFYQPRLFAPRTVSEPTSHVDLLPTLFAALHRPGAAAAAQWQGRSLLADSDSLAAPRYLYLWGNEGTLSSVSGEGCKLQITVSGGECWTYDLATDPQEQHRRPCTGHEEQRQDLLRHGEAQPEFLRARNPPETP
jgi:arylsulfatase A-like enzyme